MRFRQFILLEQDPLGGGMGAPMGGAPMDPMGGAGAPMDPMGGGAPPMGDPMGGMGSPPEPQSQPVPTHADVWEVLDAILNNKEIKQVKPPQVQPPPGGEMGGMGAPPMDPMAGGGMGGDPMMGAPPAPMNMGAPGPAGGGGPFLQG